MPIVAHRRPPAGDDRGHPTVRKKPELGAARQVPWALGGPDPDRYGVAVGLLPAVPESSGCTRSPDGIGGPGPSAGAPGSR